MWSKVSCLWKQHSKTETNPGTNHWPSDLPTTPHDKLGSFSNGDGNENVKKAIGLITKTTSLLVHYTFWYISLLSQHNQDVKFPDGTFYGGHRHTTTNFSFCFYMGAKNSTTENYTCIWHSKRVGIIAAMFEKTQVHFNSDVFAAVTSSCMYKRAVGN